MPGRPWCSTKVSGSQREHVKGGRHFGNCDDSCPDAEEGLRLHQQSQNKPSSSATGKDIFFRVSQNFKHEKFMWDQADSYSLRKRNAEKCKNHQNPTTFKGAR